MHPALDTNSNRFTNQHNIANTQSKNDYFEGFYQHSDVSQKETDNQNTQKHIDDLSWEDQIKINQEELGIQFSQDSKIEKKVKKVKKVKIADKLGVKKKEQFFDSENKIYGYFISGFDANLEADKIFDRLNGFNGKKLNYDQKLTKEEVFYLKSSKFKPSLLYSKCNDLTLSSIIQEVQNYIYPNDIQAIYPFQLEHSSLYGEEN